MVRPHIFTQAQVAQLLALARTLTRTANSPLCPENARLAIVLLYTTGLRRGELTRLTVGNYNREERLLVIRESKFHKSRLLPLSADAVREIDYLLEIRRQRRFPVTADSPLLWHRSRSYTGKAIGETMRMLLRKSGIRTSTGRLPRTHDFRHGFAFNVLLRWYRAGVDVETKLPWLATYMGHVSIFSTAYYLQFAEPLAAAASARFAKHCGALIAPEPSHGGAQ